MSIISFTNIHQLAYRRLLHYIFVMILIVDIAMGCVNHNIIESKIFDRITILTVIISLGLNVVNRHNIGVLIYRID